MKYKTAAGIILTSVCGRFFLVTPEETIHINETAAFYWKELEKGTSVDDLCSVSKEIYEIEDTDALRSDINDLIETLRNKKLLVRCSS